jgi:hypothetical protein
MADSLRFYQLLECFNTSASCSHMTNSFKMFQNWGVTLLESIDIYTRAPWITQNEQWFVASKIPHELDAQMEGH